MKKDVYGLSKQDVNTALLTDEYLKDTNTDEKEKVSIELSKEYFDNVENIAKENNVSSYAIFLACFYVLLNKYTLKEDIAIERSYLKKNIVLRKQINQDEEFIEFVKQIHKEIEETLYEKEIVLFSSNLWLKIEPNLLSLEFSTKFFKKSVAKSILAHYLYILKQACKKTTTKISDFDMITPEENRLLEKIKKNQITKDANSILSILKNPFEQVLKTEKEHRFAAKIKEPTNLQKNNHDYLKTYDYTKVNKVLERNTQENFKTISKIEPRKCFTNWGNRVSWSTYCV